MSLWRKIALTLTKLFLNHSIVTQSTFGNNSRHPMKRGSTNTTNQNTPIYTRALRIVGCDENRLQLWWSWLPADGDSGSVPVIRAKGLWNLPSTSTNRHFVHAFLQFLIIQAALAVHSPFAAHSTHLSSPAELKQDSGNRKKVLIGRASSSFTWQRSSTWQNQVRSFSWQRSSTWQSKFGLFPGSARQLDRIKFGLFPGSARQLDRVSSVFFLAALVNLTEQALSFSPVTRQTGQMQRHPFFSSDEKSKNHRYWIDSIWLT
jgi:hypothetical protein